MRHYVVAVRIVVDDCTTREVVTGAVDVVADGLRITTLDLSCASRSHLPMMTRTCRLGGRRTLLIQVFGSRRRYRWRVVADQEAARGTALPDRQRTLSCRHVPNANHPNA